MLWSVAVGGSVLVFLWQFLKPQPKPVDGVYRLPGRWYTLKKIIFRLLLVLNKRRNKRSKATHDEQYNKRGYGFGISDIHQLERCQELDKDSYGIDTVYFGAYNKDGVRLITRVARRHNRTAEVWLLLEVPGVGRLQHPLHPDTLVCNTAGNRYSAGGLKIEMIEPMKKWRVCYNGQMKFFETDNLVPVQFSLTWQTVTDPFSFDTDMNQSALADAVAREPWTKQFWSALRSTHQTHYEQWGEFRGKINITGYGEKQVILKSVRDHSFGVRDWRSFYRYSIHFIYLENGTMIQTGVVSSPATMSHIKIGYLMHANGAMCSVSDIDLKLWEVAPDGGPINNYSFTFYAGGKKYNTVVEGDWTPTWYHHDDRGSKVYEKFCNYKVNGVSGFGLVEFHYRNPNGEPYVPPESVPMLAGESDDDEDLRPYTDALTLTFQDVACCHGNLVGGKGAQLGQLTSIQDKVNVVVPKGFCVTLQAFTKQLEVNPGISHSIDRIISILRDGCHDNLQTACSDTVELIASTPVCSQVSDNIAAVLSRIFTDVDNVFLAVRSSAAGEDGSEASSAGQMETYLGVKGQKQVIDAVRKCWASAFTYQAVQYRRMNGQHIKVCVGVAIQEMVQSEVSGVLFTNNPVNGSANQILINASYGLGEAVVSGKTTPDTITVLRSWDDKLTVGHKDLGEKSVSITVKEQGGVVEQETKQQNTCCMTDERILKLSTIAVQVEHYFGSSRDIEWAMYKDQFYLLQARPITTLDQETEEDLLHEFDDPLVTGREFLTTGNIGEMMPGAVTPLTNSMFKSAINYALVGFAEIISAGPLTKHPDNMVVSCCGTLFINMTLIDTLAVNNIIGKKDAAELNLIGQAVDELPYEDVADYCGGKLSFFKRIAVFLASFGKFKDRGSRCDAWFDRVKNYTIGEGTTCCKEFYKDLDSKIKDYYDIWETSLVKSGQSGTWATVVVQTLLQGKTEYTTEICADVALLLSKCDEVYSAEVPTAIQNLAKEIEKAGCKDQFLSSSDKECVEILRNDKYGELKLAFETFLEDHGHRYVREAEFYERSWRSQPEKLVKSLKIVLKSKLYDKKPRETLSCEQAIAKIKTPLPWSAKQVLKWVLPKARKAVGQREWGKSLSIKVADKFKEAYWKLADMMVKEGRLPERELLFFLTHTEIAKLLETRSPRLISRSIRRKKLYPKQMGLKFQKMNQGRPIPMVEEDLSSQRKATFSLKGMPVCHGVVTGVCRVVKNLQEADAIQAGDILIVLYTDVGWSPYFPLLSGLVTEIGGLVSHGAVVAREFGLPCIVNVPNATNLFQSGDFVRLDGHSGTIERLEES